VDGVEGFSILGQRSSSMTITMTMKMTQEPDNNRMDRSRKSSSSSSSKSSSEALDRRRWIQSAARGAAFVAASSGIMTGNPPPSNAAYIDIHTDKPKITQTVYLDVQIMDMDKEPTRIKIGLFGDVMPKTVENFVALCVGGTKNDDEDQRNMRGYAGTTFYRVLSGITVQGGAIGPNTRNGKTGLSSFGANGEPFEPDNYNIQHSHADGLVCMVRGLGGSVDSRFFIHTNANGGWADDRYAAFGIVLNDNGMDYIHNRMDKVPVKPPSNIPLTPIQIVASGILPDK
jgi:peptidyl-prolyl cis-trans isomerase B (cyclophilin B)